MKLIIRADSNKFIALGHVMRCLSVADAFECASHKDEVLFVTASCDPKALIEKRGYDCEVLNTDYKDMCGEFPFFRPIIEQFKPDVILVDSYYVCDEYFHLLKKYAKVAYFDDFEKDAFPTDILINYNFNVNGFDYDRLYAEKGIKKPLLLEGPAYAPLRKEFGIFNTAKEREPHTPLRVLVSTGGSDSCHVALGICEDFVKSETARQEKAILSLLVGPFSEDYDKLKAYEKQFPEVVHICSNITKMAEFLSGFDIAVSAAGSTTFELCAAKIPTMLCYTADNQERIYNNATGLGLFFKGGSALNNIQKLREEAADFIDTAVGDYKKVYANELMKASYVDAKGAERIRDSFKNIQG